MCDDSGIAVGAALAVHHNILGHPLPDSRPAWSSPYLGPIHPYGEVIEAFTAAGDAINVERAQLLASGRDEIPPAMVRALGM